jgi:hypothetical protein
LIWKDHWAWPRHAGVVAKERIIYKQYRPRSLKQWRRWKPRKESYERGFEGWKEDVESWQQAIKNNREFMCDDSISPPRIDESALPRHSEAPYCAWQNRCFMVWNLAVRKCRYRYGYEVFRDFTDSRVLMT